MDMLDALMAIGGVAFLIIAGGGYLLFSTGLVELPSPTGNGFMEALEPGLEENGFEIVQTEYSSESRIIRMKDEQAEFIFACRKDPTKSLVDGNESRVYEGEVVEDSVIDSQRDTMIVSSFYEDGYLCFISSRSGRASDVGEFREVIEQYGTVMD